MQTDTSLPAAESKQHRGLGSGWMIVAAVMFALMGVFVKLGAAQFSALELVFWRTLLSTLLLGVPAWLHRQRFVTPHLKRHVMRGVVGYTALLLSYYAIVHLPLGTAVTLNYTSPMFLALLSAVILKERFSTRTVLGLLLGFCGVMLLLRPTISSDAWFAGLLGLLSGAFAGMAYLHVRELGKLGEPEWLVVFYFSLVSTAVGVLLVSLDGWHPVTLQNAWLLGGLGLTATLGQLAMTRAYKVGRKLLTANLSYLTVVFATLLGALIWGDQLPPDSYAAMAIIVISGIMASRR